MMKKFIFSMVVACAFSAPAVASAGETVGETAGKTKAGIVQEQIRITYSPEMASTVEGRERLERKIREAAAEVCGPQHLRRAGSLSLMIANRNCYQKAVADAMSAIKLPGIATTD